MYSLRYPFAIHVEMSGRQLEYLSLEFGTRVWTRDKYLGHQHVAGLTLKPSGGVRVSVDRKERTAKSSALKVCRCEGEPTKKIEKEQPERGENQERAMASKPSKKSKSGKSGCLEVQK